MANISLRSPQFKTIVVPSTGVKSTRCRILVDSNLIYTIVRNVLPSTSAYFDISELARDFINNNYSQTFTVSFIDIVTVIENFSEVNATGSVVGSASIFTDKGYEAYGTFEEGINPILPSNSWLIEKNTKSNKFEIFVPENSSGKIPYISTTNVIGYVTYTGSSTTINFPSSGTGNDLVINRISCTKYGIGTRIIFINKFGIQQSLWFFLRKNEDIKRSNTTFKSNALENPYNVVPSPTYSTSSPSTSVFNTLAQKSYTLNSGYYPEFAVEYFEQLLLSEFIWIDKDSALTDALINAIPLVLKSSNVSIKTSVNDRLIEYTMQFDDAFDYINNIR